MTILITGATGTLGRQLHALLAKTDTPVRVLSRKAPPAGQTPGSWATGNLTTGDRLEAALRGAHTVVHCATDGRTDVASARNLVSAAKKAGVSHLVYISIVGVDRHPLFYYQAKLKVEQLLESSGLPWTILRATQFHDLVRGMFRAQRMFPVVFAPSFSIQPIDAHDVAGRLAELATSPPAGHVDDIGGPEILASRQLATRYLDATRNKRAIVPIRLPGKTFDAYAAGIHLTPDHRYGRTTFAEFLETRLK